MVDDPHANDEAARSVTRRDKVFQFTQSVVRTRLAPNGIMVVTASRFNEDDLSGRLLAAERKGREHWDRVHLPAIAEANDQLIVPREIGEALWPAQFDLDNLLATKSALGSYLWAALYQSRPAPEEGSQFKRGGARWFTEDADHFILHADDKPDEFVKKRSAGIFMACAPAFTEGGTTSDQTAIVIVASLPKHRLLVKHVFQGRLAGEDVARKVAELYRDWGAKYVLLQDVGAQKWLKPVLLAEGIANVKLVPARGSKVERSTPASIWWNDGRIYMAQAAWNDSFAEQLFGFPNSAHDDAVDALAYIVLYLTEHPSRGGNFRATPQPVGVGPSPWSGGGGRDFASDPGGSSSRPPWIS